MALPLAVTARILVLLDDLDRAAPVLAYALALATPHSELVLAPVGPRPAVDEDPRGEVQEPAASTPDVVPAAEEAALARVSQQWGLPADRTRVAPRTGNPVETLADLDVGGDCTLVILAGHRGNARWRRRWSSLADRLTRHVPVPVLIVGSDHHPGVPGTAATVHRLVVPLDGSPRAEQALPVARTLARQLRVPVLLVRVVPPPDLPDVLAVGTGTAGTPPPPPGIGRRSERTVASDTAARYLAAVGHLALGGVETILDVRVGAVVPRLLEVVEPTDVVVLLGSRRRGVRRWLRDSVADTLVRHTAAPVCQVPATPSPGRGAD